MSWVDADVSNMKPVVVKVRVPERWYRRNVCQTVPSPNHDLLASAASYFAAMLQFSPAEGLAAALIAAATIDLPGAITVRVTFTPRQMLAIRHGLCVLELPADATGFWWGCSVFLVASWLGGPKEAHV